MQNLKKKSDVCYQTEKKIIINYLKKHPNFLMEEPELLVELELVHKVHDKQLSLIDKQISLLRAKNKQLETSIKNISNVAHYNSVLYEKLRKLIYELVKTTTFEETVSTLISQLASKFKLEHVVVLSWKIPKQPIKNLKQLGLQDHWMQALQQELQTNTAVCGKIEHDWQRGLFDKAISSVCIIPLSSQELLWGAIILGSESTRFDSSLGTQFLMQVGEIFALKLEQAFN